MNDTEEYNTFVEAESGAIMPLNSKCLDFDWRESLKQGDIIDALDTDKKWYRATVLAVKSENSIKSVYIGYRIYDPKGDKVDSNGRYFGWTKKFDEWLNVHSPRIHKKNFMVNKFYIPKKNLSGSSNYEEIIDDANDHI